MARRQSLWEEESRAGGDWCFARRVAGQRERESACERVLRALRALNFILASSGAEIDIATEGSVCDGWSYLLDQAQ